MPTNDPTPNWPPPTWRTQAGIPQLEPADKGALAWLLIGLSAAGFIALALYLFLMATT